jgi:transcriptional regulator with XRE-family HTH domain
MTEKLPADIAHPVDLYVGARLRIRRKVLGFSQTQLAEALGITFQQIQKYERGANRISASKLYEAARLLQSPVAYFFEGLDETPHDDVDDGIAQRMTQFVATPEGLELAGLFPRLQDRRLRRRVVDLVKAMVDDEPVTTDS